MESIEHLDSSLNQHHVAARSQRLDDPTHRRLKGAGRCNAPGAWTSSSAPLRPAARERDRGGGSDRGMLLLCGIGKMNNGRRLEMDLTRFSVDPGRG